MGFYFESLPPLFSVGGCCSANGWPYMALGLLLSFLAIVTYTPKIGSTPFSEPCSHWTFDSNRTYRQPLPCSQPPSILRSPINLQTLVSLSTKFLIQFHHTDQNRPSQSASSLIGTSAGQFALSSFSKFFFSIHSPLKCLGSFWAAFRCVS